MHTRRSPLLRIALALAALAAASPASAVEIGDGKLTINGNGAWSFERTDANRFGLGDPDGNYSTTEFDLLLNARPATDLVISAQLGFDQEEVDLEWAFAEYRLHDLARVRAGKVKQPFGNYGELQFVGTARPFFDLAMGVYGPANVTATSYSGVGLTGEHVFSSGFGVQYDAYGGALELPAFEPFDALAPDFDPSAPEEGRSEEVEHIMGGRVSLLTPWDVAVRFSSYGGRMLKDEDGEVTFAVYGGSLWYRGERVWLSAEVFHSIEVGYEKQLSGYVEAAAFVLPKVQLAARYERARVTMEETTDANSPLLQHDEVGVGVNYWFSPQLVVKAAFLDAMGERFVELADDATELSEHTRRVVAGVQFTF